jgi:7,8-dihydropterin-6-yl-methyl-4-(beta-D-ribofuranosyl)aminobenzene 5'-phosphate synthase
LTLHIVYDNNAHASGLTADWGFGCVIEGLEQTILFDAGAKGQILLNNMAAMGIDPKAIDIVVISHNHGDHRGGLAALLRENPDVTVYLPPNVSRQMIKRYEAQGATVAYSSGTVRLCEGAHTTGALGSAIAEQGLVIETPRGPVILTGCAHPGIVAMVQQAATVVPGEPLLVMGGFHLSQTSTARIEGIMADLEASGVRHVAPTHCSGDRARGLFEQTWDEGYVACGVGRVVRVEALQ